MRRQVIGIFLAFAIILGLFPPIQTTARAEELAVTEETTELPLESDESANEETEILLEETEDENPSEWPQEWSEEEHEESAASSVMESEEIPVEVSDTTEDFTNIVPQLTAISGGGTNVTIQWNAVAGAEQYGVYRKTSDSEWEKLGTATKSETEYVDSTAKGSVSYYYSIRAEQKKNGKTIRSKRSDAFLRVGRPTLKPAEEITGAVKVRWRKVDGAESYRIYRRTKSSSKWTQIGNSDINGYRDYEAKTGKTYYYTVSAVCSNYGAEFVGGYNKDGVSAKRVLTAPDITALSGLKTKVTLEWNAVSSAEFYVIDRMEYGGAWEQLDTTTALSYRDVNASTETTYYYRVRAAKTTSTGSLAYGEAQDPLVQRPGGTTMLGVESSGSGLVVKWEAVPGVVTYRVYRRSTQDEKWSCIDTVSETYYQDDSVVAGTYWYTVRAVSQNPTTFYSAFDKEGVSGTKKLATPSMVKISNVDSGIRVEWEQVNQATGYFVYRKEKGESKWKQIGTVSRGDKVVYVDRTAKEETTYTYTVCASYQDVKAGNRNSKGLTIQRIKTPKMKEISKQNEGLKVRWNAVSYADGYYVYRRSSTSAQWTKIAEISGGKETYYEDDSVSNGKWYNYTVRAFCGSYYSGITSEGKSYAYLKPVSIESIQHSKSQTVEVAWSSNSQADRYVISYATKEDFSDAKTTTAETNSATLSGLTKGEIYYIRVNVRKQIDGVKYFSRWSAVRAVAIDK